MPPAGLMYRSFRMAARAGPSINLPRGQMWAVALHCNSTPGSHAQIADPVALATSAITSLSARHSSPLTAELGGRSSGGPEGVADERWPPAV